MSGTNNTMNSILRQIFISTIWSIPNYSIHFLHSFPLAGVYASIILSIRRLRRHLEWFDTLSVRLPRSWWTKFPGCAKKFHWKRPKMQTGKSMNTYPHSLVQCCRTIRWIHRGRWSSLTTRARTPLVKRGHLDSFAIQDSVPAIRHCIHCLHHPGWRWKRSAPGPLYSSRSYAIHNSLRNLVAFQCTPRSIRCHWGHGR